MGPRNQMGKVRVLPKRDTGVQVVDALAGAPAEPARRAAAADDDRIEPVLVRMTRGQKKALNAEANRRNEETGSARPGLSEVLREFFDACYDGWLEGRR